MLAESGGLIGGAKHIMTNQAELPKQLVWTVLALCALPTLLNFAGVDFGAKGSIDPGDPQFLEAIDSQNLDPQQIEQYLGVLNELDRQRKGMFIHTILEWTAFCIAIFTGAFAFIHYQIKRDVTTPIIGTALISSGMIDAFNVLAADDLIQAYAENDQFVPFSWAISRTFNVCFMILGAGMFLGRGREGIVRPEQRGIGFVLVVSLSFAVIAYSIISVCANLPPDTLPKALFEDADQIPRPWDLPPLLLLLIAGGVIFPRFYRQHPSLFSHGLFVSVVPQVATQLHAAFGSYQLYDNHFNIAYFLKIVAYLVPLTGLMLDYIRAYQAEAILVATEEKLRFARRVQQNLLPTSAPEVAGYDLAGVSYPAEAVGGDYFDYIPMQGGGYGIVIADVSGHDLGASIFMAQTRAYLRALAHTQSDVAEIIRILNKNLVADTKDRRFVTLFLVRIDPGSRKVIFAAQGHQGYVLRRTGELETLHAVGPPLGLLDNVEMGCGPDLELATGDILLELTDGILEALSPAGEQFGVDRAIDCVTAHRDEPARQIVDALWDAVQEHQGNIAQSDDVTLVVLKSVAES